MVSDIVLDKDLPENLKNSVEAYAGCIAGASLKSDYLKAIKSAGFQKVKLVGETRTNIDPADYKSTGDIFPIISLKVSAAKPK